MFSTVLNYSKEEKNSIQTSISGTGGEDNQFSYGLSGNSQENGPSGYAMNGGYRSPYVNITTTVGHDTQNNNQRSFGASGAVVAHPYGVTLSNDLSDTFAIIHAEGAQGLPSIMPLVVVWIFGEMVLFLMLHPMRKSN